MVIDGFKSYAQRTVISDWDRHFTAITGLNGSGKSNILDAICFVLGITNLSQVRVENLQQLVYKEGQARVTRASVSLVFDNRDTSESPIGYEDFEEITVTRQVVIGGRNKYMINGQTAQLGRIRDLFHSVQLDVNNPHFLIMQGRITKVLNMKPNEILGMIQEAAGTKMYELKKAQAIKTMNKKQIKVNEINEILEEEITPQLEKLRKEKQHYLQWTKNNQEIDKLNRLIVICKFIKNYQLINTGNQQIQELTDTIHESNAQMEFLKDDIEKTKNEISVKQSEKLQNEQGTILTLTNELNQKNKSLKSLQQQYKNQNDAIKRENKELKQIDAMLVDHEQSIKEKEKEFIEYEQNYKKVDEQYKYLQDRIDSLESQQLGIGMDDEKRDSGSLAQQLMEAKRLKSDYNSQITTTKQQIKNIEKEVNKLKKQIKIHDNNNNKLQSEVKAKEEQLAALQAKCNHNQDRNSNHNSNPHGHGNDDDEKYEENLQNEIDAKNQLLYRLRGELEGLQREASQFDFQYADPYRNFDRRKVYGKLGKLLSVKSNEYCRAIEICAGGRLYNVVVDSNETAKDILNNGRLRQRVTIIPLNKIAGKSIHQAVIEKAKSLVGDEHCNLALDLVGYDEQLEKAMKYVFGNTLVCTDMNSAKQVAFDRDIFCKSVTLDGEVFNPQGTLTGGSSNRTSSVLENMRVFQVKQNEYGELQEQIKRLKASLHEFHQQNEQNQQIRQDIDLLTHEITVLKERINDSAYASLQGRINELEQELNKQQIEVLADLERKYNMTQQKCIDLEQDMENYEQRKKDQQKHVKQQIVECKKQLSKLENEVKEYTENKNRISLQIEDLREEYSSNEQQRRSIQECIEQYQAKCKQIQAEIDEIQQRNQAIEEELDIERKKLSQQDEELKKLEKIVSKNEKQYAKMDINCNKLSRELQNLNDDIKSSKKQNEKLLAEYEWLQQESQDMDALYQQYDNNDGEQIAKRRQKLKEEQSTLSNRINHKVMSMFERAENEYRDLIKKREIIRNDKKKIESVIRELDKKKEDTLENTYKKVNEHFGNIFSKLLPGTQCKLAKIKPSDADDEDDDHNDEQHAAGSDASILDGLEVKVSFGVNERNDPIWKESLSELSGGQRSLLALSLILSLLLFKPAPLYILDEIDAALDLSHTQNIGILISKYFAKSQFIVVSLKEGMFTNANVIFRTSFVDGVSAVKRSVGSGLRNNNNNSNNGR